ncbi:putative cytochrome P450 [Colletotrichum sublineola]|uniref:Putative cytochrome P450 n=1 Tax=Colletotrichum sublineola TaxID=1173701 RepID=A0A066WYL2_COLSU|nr:putative cytochrome P450 [Colletotrichum sublineola]
MVYRVTDIRITATWRRLVKDIGLSTGFVLRKGQKMKMRSTDEEKLASLAYNPQLMPYGMALLPDPSAVLLIRRRKEEIDLYSLEYRESKRYGMRERRQSQFHWKDAMLCSIEHQRHIALY